MKQLSLLDLLRVWAALTGLVIAFAYFGALFLGVTAPVMAMLPLLISAIGGFELFLFAQDFWMKRSRGRG